MKVIKIVTILLQISFSAIGQNNLNHAIGYCEEEINIDGNLDESAWSQMVPFTNFKNHFPIDEGLSQHQTEVKIFHNGKCLYIGVVYYDSETRNNISSLKRDVYREFEAIIGNINETNESWNTAWKGEVQSNGLIKKYELAIPLDAINFNNRRFDL